MNKNKIKTEIQLTLCYAILNGWIYANNAPYD